LNRKKGGKPRAPSQLEKRIRLLGGRRLPAGKKGKGERKKKYTPFLIKKEGSRTFH